MKLPCPGCSQPVSIGAQTMGLLQSLFEKLAGPLGSRLYVLCDACGLTIQNSYKETYEGGV